MLAKRALLVAIAAAAMLAAGAGDGLAAPIKVPTGLNPGDQYGAGVRIYNLGGLLVASNNAELWQFSIANTISLTGDGSQSSMSSARTGTLADVINQLPWSRWRRSAAPTRPV